jgi:hypothetical protein
VYFGQLAPLWENKIMMAAAELTLLLARLAEFCLLR